MLAELERESMTLALHMLLHSFAVAMERLKKQRS
jgi:hypothetical protein